MHVALKGRAAQLCLLASGRALAHEILTAECPFQELARSVLGGDVGGWGEQEGHINILGCNLLLDKLPRVIG